MQHFPIFLDLAGQRVVVSGAGETAVAKLRLLLKTRAAITVFGPAPAAEIAHWAAVGRLALHPRALAAGDADGARLLYAANDDGAEDARAAAIGRQAGALVNVVDDLHASDFITPAIVDRDPVTVAIGTEGAAPVLARRIKADVEERLPPETGDLARIGQAFRSAAAALPHGGARRRFWARYFDDVGPRALRAGGEDGARRALEDLLRQEAAAGADPGQVILVGAGPGDPELLTLRARRELHEADTVIHDRLVPAAILELARREATIVEVGKTPFGPAWRQEDINALMIAHAERGERVVRLKSGDPGIYGRLDEEMDALDAAGIAFDIVPGITTASAAAAATGVSLTRRGRNSGLSILTGHDIDGFAEHDWRALARPGSVAAIYMGIHAARFLQSRLMMHGAAFDTPLTVVENVARSDQRTIATTLADLSGTVAQAAIGGPAIILLGLSPWGAAAAAQPAAPAALHEAL